MELILYIDITLHCLFNKTLYVLSVCLRVTEDSLSATVANACLLSTAVNTHSCISAGLISFSTLTELLQWYIDKKVKQELRPNQNLLLQSSIRSRAHVYPTQYVLYTT